ncbi:hypothetical protein [Pedosphaera parvula]|uniref:Uncharacterized protein n=1 Tax=Pedosphaera parvula (strain Ellin514) TaxID=320771 RepID=B9XT28_PEDPL|nr:hypothetical protein [Pedosphaera parvula]EEF57002.1 hypothetical protein Cflav_PD0047 [Pedosphaera parvula Ellin514]
MEKILSRINLAGWVYSLLASIGYVIVYPPGPTLASMLSAKLNLGIKASGVFLAFMMCKQIRQVLVWPLVCISLLTLGKFYLNTIVFVHMVPKGFTFGQSCADWWHMNAAKPPSAVGIILPGLFTIISLVFWSAYGLLTLRPVEKRG